MSRLQSAFFPGRPAIVPFVSAGDPAPGIVADVVVALAEAGAAVVELGIPFSDPIADGPTIAAASQRALGRGFKLEQVFDALERIRARSEVPVVLFTYCNPVLRHGIDRFFDRAARSGADGVLMPDLPPEEATDVLRAAGKAGLDAVFLAAPTTTPERLAKIAGSTRGFLYLVAALGVTGARTALAVDLQDQVHRAKQAARVPVAVGFGLSTPEQARHVAGLGADGIVVGSALVDRLHRWHQGGADVVFEARTWLSAWVEALAE